MASAAQLTVDRTAAATVAGQGGAAGREEPWIVAGVAAAIAPRLRLTPGTVRAVFVVLGIVAFWPVLAVYGACALVVPHVGRRRPGVTNLVGFVRLSVVAALIGLTPQLSLDQYGIFGAGEAVWIPVGGAVLAGAVALLAMRRPVSPGATAGDRRWMLSALPACLLAAVAVAGTILAPGVRFELVLALGLVAIGALVAVAGSRLDLPAALVSSAVVGLGALVLIGSGARLQGGVGDLTAAPRSVAQLAPAYRRAIGDLTLDLRGLRLGPGVAAHVSASVGFGNLRLELPGDATGTVAVSIGAGNLNGDVLGPGATGFMVRRTVRITPPGPPRRAGGLRAGGLRVDISARVGDGCVLILTPDGSASC